MQIKFRIILASLVLLTFASNSYAAGVPITGTAYGEKIGLFHFDPATAKRPSGTADDSRFDNPSFYIGPTKQFYIPFNDPDFTGPDYTGQDPTRLFNLNMVANISTEPDDCTVTIGGCLLKGFIWSDTIGWIALDGTQINEALKQVRINELIAGGMSLQDAESQAETEENTNAAPYPSGYFPRIKTTGELTGYAWNEKTGWIKLSANDTTGTTTPAASQTVNNWGVWLDIAGDFIIIDDVELGHRFRGYAWSENMGWIKFGIEQQNEFPENIRFLFDFFAGFTTWIPDSTPPIILSPDLVWFAVGKNTGYEELNEPTTIIYKFAEDPETNINVINSEVSVKRFDDQEPVTCLEPVPASITLVRITGEIYATLSIPTIGNLQNVTKGYCKYKINAKIVNGVNLPTYVGKEFLPPAITQPDQEEIIVYVRAGDYDATKSRVIMPSTTAIADGKDAVEYKVELKDLVGNPIVDVDCRTEYAACPEREVTLTASLLNELIYDMSAFTPPASPYPTPVKHSDDNVGTDGEYLLDTDPPVEVQWNDADLLYPLEIASYAPSETYLTALGITATKNFRINSFDYTIQDAALPATNLRVVTYEPLVLEADTATEIPACNYPDPDPGPPPICDILNDPNPGQVSSGFVLANINFIAPVFTNNPTIEAGGLENVLSLSVPANLSFDLNNISSKAIAFANTDDDDGGLSIDHIIQLYSPSGDLSVASMETHRIRMIDPDAVDKTTPDPDEDGNLGWSDPFVPDAHYELYDGDYSDTAPLTPLNSVFFSSYRQYHPPDNFCKDIIAGLCIQSNINVNNGVYPVSGVFGIPQTYESFDPLIDPVNPSSHVNYPQGEIDRSESVELGLAGTSDIKKEIRFTPETFLEDEDQERINDVKLRLIQEIAYRFPNQPVFTIYAQSPLIEGIDVKGLGVEAIGTVAVEQIVTGRQFESVGTTGARQLQEQIRRNVAQLTTGINPCTWPVNQNDISLTSFPTSGACVTEDQTTGSMFAFYEGDSSKNLILDNLDNGGNGLLVPNQPYTIIVKGGANIFIKDNIYYNPNFDKSSFGMILIADTVGDGANVYIASSSTNNDPTNIVGVLYAEGSLLSKSSETNNLLYYGRTGGGAGGNPQDLANQLYWQGSIASRNTIGGAGRGLIPPFPENPCLDQDTDLSCAQRYDLDFLRRFSVSIEPGVSSLIANNGLFSGGGQCDPAAGTCSCVECIPGGTSPTPKLPTLIRFKGNQQIDPDNSELAPFFIKTDPRALNNPPPGFFVSVGLEAIPEIR